MVVKLKRYNEFRIIYTCLCTWVGVRKKWKRETCHYKEFPLKSWRILTILVGLNGGTLVNVSEASPSQSDSACHGWQWSTAHLHHVLSAFFPTWWCWKFVLQLTFNQFVEAVVNGWHLDTVNLRHRGNNQALWCYTSKILRAKAEMRRIIGSV